MLTERSIVPAGRRSHWNLRRFAVSRVDVRREVRWPPRREISRRSMSFMPSVRSGAEGRIMSPGCWPRLPSCSKLAEKKGRVTSAFLRSVRAFTDTAASRGADRARGGDSAFRVAETKLQKAVFVLFDGETHARVQRGASDAAAGSERLRHSGNSDLGPYCDVAESGYTSYNKRECK